MTVSVKTACGVSVMLPVPSETFTVRLFRVVGLAATCTLSCPSRPISFKAAKYMT